MKSIRIKSDGNAANTLITIEDGTEVKGVVSVGIDIIGGNNPVRATLDISHPALDVVAQVDTDKLVRETLERLAQVVEMHQIAEIANDMHWQHERRLASEAVGTGADPSDAPAVAAGDDGANQA